MTAAAGTGRMPEPSSADTKTSSRWIVAALMVIVPIVSGLLWYRASDDPLWTVFRNSLNLCNLESAQLSPVSPDGRYRVHVVQATCLARFPETMVFVAEAEEPFSAAAVDSNRAVLEVAGHRTLDAAIWKSAAESADNRMSLHLWMLKGSMPSQLHRFEDRWRDVPIYLDNSKPAPGAEKLDY
jgi:hypothetical protein